MTNLIIRRFFFCIISIIGTPYILPPFSFQRALVTIPWPEGLFSCRISGFPLFKVSESWCAFLDWVTLPSLRIWAPNSFFNPPKIHDYTSNQKVAPNFSLKIFCQIRCPLLSVFAHPRKIEKYVKILGVWRNYTMAATEAVMLGYPIPSLPSKCVNIFGETVHTFQHTGYVTAQILTGW